MPLAQYTLNSLIVVALAVPIDDRDRLVGRLRHGAATRAACAARWWCWPCCCAWSPVTALWLTRFLLFKELMLIDTLWVLVVPALMGTNPFFVLLFYWTFRRIPRELFESARLDGAGPLSIWARVAMPLARPTTTAVSVLAFTVYWSDFINPLLYLKSESHYTLPVGLRVLQQMDRSNWPLLMAGVVVMAAPVLILFLLMQRYFWPEGRLAGIAGH